MGACAGEQARSSAPPSAAPASQPAKPPEPTSSAPVAPASPTPTAVAESKPAPAAEPEPKADPPDPELLRQLSLGALEPERFRKASLSVALEAARRSYRATVYAVRSGRWREELRTSCKVNEAGGRPAKALVTDEQGRVRALVILTGSDDSFWQLRYLFDDHERIRLLFLAHADVTEAASQHLVVFGQGGDVLACDRILMKRGSAPFENFFCGSPEPDVPEPRPKLDRAVQQALREQPPPPQKPQKARNELLEHHRTIVPRAEFDECLPTQSP